MLRHTDRESLNRGTAAAKNAVKTAFFYLDLHDWAKITGFGMRAAFEIF